MPSKLLLCWQRNKCWGHHCWVEYLPCSPVLGYLAAGILIGPFGLSIIHNVHGTKEIAEFGVVFLLFNIGLELSVERLSPMKKYVFALGSAQVLVTAVVAGILARFIARQPCPAALIIGNGLALSSTAVVLQVVLNQYLFTGNNILAQDKDLHGLKRGIWGCCCASLCTAGVVHHSSRPLLGWTCLIFFPFGCQRSNSLATIEGYSGYGAEQGEKLLGATIASTFYANLGIEEDDVFISDGAKSDISRLQIIRNRFS